MSFAVVKFNCIDRWDQKNFKNRLDRDYDGVIEWEHGVYSVELENVKEIVALKETFKKNLNVKIEWAAAEERILEFLQKT